ncbi:hypothetical protein BDV26DRAFT_108563 [Aspergillus bertholletiae]|uniref:Uncharacterized protein n=1 Tax=Aspergillus bertholletiae TaxID=1226010 RepID=A0A5N7AQE7_9EURO|nr:hypothetical protein BDV26DRAFT_108563 [Aspergillus bertholletiae]
MMMTRFRWWEMERIEARTKNRRWGSESRRERDRKRGEIKGHPTKEKGIKCTRREGYSESRSSSDGHSITLRLVWEDVVPSCSPGPPYQPQQEPHCWPIRVKSDMCLFNPTTPVLFHHGRTILHHFPYILPFQIPSTPRSSPPPSFHLVWPLLLSPTVQTLLTFLSRTRPTSPREDAKAMNLQGALACRCAQGSLLAHFHR